ncbi:MAG: type II toxin-antitoxin system RelE/ParE family toxin [Pseudomonadota bacterium]
MIKHIKYHPRLEKQCKKLNKSGAKARKAVKKALDVLLKFKTSKKDFSQIGSLSHYGELRLKDCIKYRLGNGYRLVVLIKKQALFVLFIGSHDQCNQWLETNRGTEKFCFSNQEKVLIKSLTQTRTQNSALNKADPDVFNHVEDKVLRQVFNGLCNATS